MHSIRRAAARAILTNSASATAVAPKSKTVAFSSRGINAPAIIAARHFSVAAPKAFSPSVACRDEQEPRQEASQFFREPRQPVRPQEDLSEHVLFVQNYSFDVKAEDLSEAFSKYGEVVGVSMPPKRTYCFVYYKDAESVDKAVENVDGTFWHGRRIVVKARERGAGIRGQGDGDQRDRRGNRGDRVYSGPPTKTLYIGNIAFEASDTDLNNLFATLKDLKDVRVAVDRATGWPRGFAHADFNSVDSAKAALEVLQNSQIRGRDLRVGYAPESRNESNRSGRTSFRSSTETEF